MKERLDKIMMDRNLCASRAQAQALIMDGKVRVNGEVQTKPGTQTPSDARIEVTGVQPYVSRGGLKLEKALQVFAVSPQERVCMDIGAATGGFTDCLLQHGAAQVIAVDVGYGQLDWKLRQDKRVQVLEKTNIRDLKPNQLAAVPTLGVVDTSFISLKKVLPPLAALLSSESEPESEIIALLKPQFEHKDYIDDPNFKGVVHHFTHHQCIVSGVLADLQNLLPDWQRLGLDFSPITGPKGNIEYLLHYRRLSTPTPPVSDPDPAAQVRDIINKSYEFHRASSLSPPSD